LNALAHEFTEFEDLAGEAIICLPDLDSIIVSPCPAFGVGGRGLPLVLDNSLPAFAPRGPRISYSPERGAFSPGRNTFAIARFLIAIANMAPVPRYRQCAIYLAGKAILPPHGLYHLSDAPYLKTHGFSAQNRCCSSLEF